MNKSKILIVLVILIAIFISLFLKRKDGELVSEFKTYDPPICAAEHVHKVFSDINFSDIESVLNGCTVLSNSEQCKIFFHSNEWADLDQRERDKHAYWKSTDTLKKRGEKTYYLCSFKYDSLESGTVTFVIISDNNGRNNGMLFPLLFAKERDGWRMALSDVGYGKDIEMFYGDWEFWKNLSNINEDTIREEFRKIRESLKEDSSHELEVFN